MTTLIENLPQVGAGFLRTLYLVAAATALSLLGGGVLAVFRIAPVPVLQRFSALYVEVFRNIPAPLFFFFFAFALPQVGIRIGFFLSALGALSVYYAAFFCEAIRSGINAIPAGQLEAARSIGLGFSGVLRFVVGPQALRTVIPPLVNNFVALTKNTAVAGAFGVMELFASGAAVINEDAGAVLWVLAAVSLAYLLITVPAGILANRIERRTVILR